MPTEGLDSVLRQLCDVRQFPVLSGPQLSLVQRQVTSKIHSSTDTQNSFLAWGPCILSAILFIRAAPDPNRDSAKYQLMATEAENGRRGYWGEEGWAEREPDSATIPTFSFLKWPLTIWGLVPAKGNSRISREMGNNQGQAWRGQPDPSGAVGTGLLEGDGRASLSQPPRSRMVTSQKKAEGTKTPQMWAEMWAIAALLVSMPQRTGCVMLGNDLASLIFHWG